MHTTTAVCSSLEVYSTKTSWMNGFLLGCCVPSCVPLLACIFPYPIYLNYNWILEAITLPIFFFFFGLETLCIFPSHFPFQSVIRTSTQLFNLWNKAPNQNPNWVALWHTDSWAELVPISEFEDRLQWLRQWRSFALMFQHEHPRADCHQHSVELQGTLWWSTVILSFTGTWRPSPG